MEGPISFWGYKEQESNLILPEHDDDDDDNFILVIDTTVQNNNNDISLHFKPMRLIFMNYSV